MNMLRHNSGHRMVIDRHRIGRSVENRAGGFADALARGNVERHEHVERLAPTRNLRSGYETVRPRQEGKLVVDRGILHQKQLHLLSQSAKNMRQGKLRAQAIAIGAYMAAKRKCLAGTQDIGDLLQGRVRLRGCRHAIRFPSWRCACARPEWRWLCARPGRRFYPKRSAARAPRAR